MQNIESKYEWADNIRAIAIISVVILHVSAPILYQYGKVSNSVWWLGNVIDGMVRYCVPIFLMLSGALLIPKSENYSIFIQNRLTRLVYPFMFWFVIYSVMNLVHLYKTNQGNITSQIWLDIQKGSSYHLWYIYMLIGIYLFIPIIREWLKKATNSTILLFLSIWFITLFFEFPFAKPYKINFDLTYFSGYLGYVVLGYFLTYRININIFKSAIIYFIGISITIYFTYYFTSKTATYYRFFYHYLTPNVALMSIGMLMIIKNTSIKNQLIQNMIKVVSQYSYGIYLAHPFILKLLETIKIDWKLGTPILGVFSTTVIALFLSVYLVKFISILPYGHKISG